MRRTRLIRRTSRRTWRVRVLISFLLFVEESYLTACSASVQQTIKTHHLSNKQPKGRRIQRDHRKTPCVKGTTTGVGIGSRIDGENCVRGGATGGDMRTRFSWNSEFWISSKIC